MSVSRLNSVLLWGCLTLWALCLAGCSLPLCDEGEYRCLYGEDCTGDDCKRCDPDKDKNCEEVLTPDLFGYECKLKQCKNENWKHIQDCEHGFNGNSSCLTECVTGLVRCVDDEDNSVLDDDISCWLQVCNAQGAWDRKENCPYGWKQKEGKCVDPCVLSNADTNSTAKRYETVSDNLGNVFKCTAAGWSVDRSCIYDFVFDDQSEEKITIPARYFSDELKNSTQEDISDLSQGHCGECSSDQMPLYYAKYNDDGETQCIVHECKNGKIVVEPTDSSKCNANNSIQKCPADSSQPELFVDISNNRFHCGGCNHECSSSQRCIEGVCKASVSCVGGYANIMAGSRLIKAFCVDNAETLATINTPRQDNYDRAYILLNDIVLSKDWKPIGTEEKPFGATLYGNGHTIILEANENLDSLSVFGEMNGASVQDLRLDLSKNQGKYTLSVDFYGMLVRNAMDSTIENIQVDWGNIQINGNGDKQWLEIGGIAGRLINSRITGSKVSGSVDVSLNPNAQSASSSLILGGLVGYGANVTISDCELGADVSGIYDSKDTYSSVGGLIGRVKKLNSISNISTVDGGIHVTGYRNIGGLIGHLDQDDVKGTISQISHFEAELTGYVQNVGGLAGSILASGADTVLEVSDFDISSYIIFNKSENSVVNEITPSLDAVVGIYDNGNGEGRYMRRMGGVFGSIELQADGTYPDRGLVVVSEGKVQFGLTDRMQLPTKSSNSEFGAVAGYSTQTTYKSVKASWKESEFGQWTSFVGGFVGYSVDSIFESCEAANLKINENTDGYRTYISGFAGYSLRGKYNQIKVSNIALTNDKSLSVSGGMIGVSQKDILMDATLSDIQVEGSSMLGCMVGLMDESAVNGVNLVNGVNSIRVHPDYAYTLMDYDLPNGGTSHSGRYLMFFTLSGGLIGIVLDSQLSDVHIEMDSVVSDNGTIGGIAGAAENTRFDNIRLNQNKSLEMNASSAGGMIGYVKSGVSIDNATIGGGEASLTISSKSEAGGMIGQVESPANIKNCVLGSVDKPISVSGGSRAGGLIGSDYSSTIQKVIVYNDMLSGTDSNSDVGGLIGNGQGARVSGVEIHYCGIEGKRIGGLIGYSKYAQVSEVKIFGNEDSKMEALEGVAGGLIGLDEASVVNDVIVHYNSITADAMAGGLIGFTYNSQVVNAEVLGNTVSSINAAGGVVGEGGGSLTLDRVIVQSRYIEGMQYAGGLVGNSQNSTLNIARSQVYVTLFSLSVAGGLVGVLGERGGVGSAMVNQEIYGTSRGNLNVSNTTGVIFMDDNMMRYQGTFLGILVRTLTPPYGRTNFSSSSYILSNIDNEVGSDVDSSAYWINKTYMRSNNDNATLNDVRICVKQCDENKTQKDYKSTQQCNDELFSSDTDVENEICKDQPTTYTSFDYLKTVNENNQTVVCQLDKLFDVMCNPDNLENCRNSITSRLIAAGWMQSNDSTFNFAFPAYLEEVGCPGEKCHYINSVILPPFCQTQ